MQRPEHCKTPAARIKLPVGSERRKLIESAAFAKQFQENEEEKLLNYCVTTKDG